MRCCPSGRVEVQPEKGLVDLGQGGEVGKCNPFVDLVRPLPDEAELGDRATGSDEAGVGSAAGGAEFGCLSGDPTDSLGKPLADSPGRDEKRFATDRDVELITPTHHIEPL